MSHLFEEKVREFTAYSDDNSIVIEEYAIMCDTSNASSESRESRRTGTKFSEKESGRSVNKNNDGSYEIPALDDKKKYFEK